VNELACIASDLKPDVIALTETWCNSEISNAVLSIDGYELVPELRLDRTNTGGGRGGGLIIYARSGIQILKIDRTILHSQLCSFSICDVTINLVYRPPSAPPESITELAKLVSEAKNNEIFVGDFNLPIIDWVGGGGSSGREGAFVEATENALMQQLVDFATHTRGNIFDLVLTNIPERVEEIYEAGRLGRSDHVIIVTRVGVGGEEARAAPPPRKRLEESRLASDERRVGGPRLARWHSPGERSRSVGFIS
jgi:hypothetical protein